MQNHYNPSVWFRGIAHSVLRPFNSVWVHRRTFSLERPVRGHADGTEVGVLHVELLKLGQDVLAVRVLAERGHVWTDFVHEQLTLCWLGHVNHLLHDVVGELVLHHCV